MAEQTRLTPRLPGWPDRGERRRLLWLWRRARRQPQRTRQLPPAWRRQRRLAFWWTLAAEVLDDPWRMGGALVAVPAWALLLAWRWHAG